MDMAGQFDVAVANISADATTTEVLLDVRARASNVRGIMSPTTMQARVNGQWVNAKMFRDVKLENVEDEEVFVVTFFREDLTQWDDLR